MKFLIILCFAVSGCLAVNYCDTLHQCGSVPNIGCSPPASQCDSTFSMINLDASSQQFIVDYHNKLRNQLAGGNYHGFNAAAAMPTMVWDQELAYLASLLAKTCVFAHDVCHRTLIAPFSGQNIAKAMSSVPTSNTTGFLQNLMQAWWDENTQCTQSIINSYPSNAIGVGHFTVMAHEKNKLVGCAASQWFDGTWYNQFLVCNYGYTNMVGQPIYTSSLTPASACVNWPSTTYPNLCP